MDVRVDALARNYGALEAVRGISFEIPRGVTFGLLGPNGAGKTSTLSMLSTLLAPSAGDASIFGKSLVGDTVQVKRLVGLAPQEISLYPELTAEENLAFFGRLHGVRGRELRRRGAELLELVGLSTRRAERVRVYSGGMRRRLNLACSLVHEPALLLLDEPTAGVDPQSREKLFAAVRRIAERGTTVIYTTHYMEEAERLCDRIAIMDEGRIVASGDLEELLRIIGSDDVIEIRCAREALDPARLRELPQVTRVEPTAGGLRVFVDDAARALGPIAAACSDAWDAVDGVAIQPVSLERVFMHLTGKELRD